MAQTGEGKSLHQVVHFSTQRKTATDRDRSVESEFAFDTFNAITTFAAALNEYVVRPRQDDVDLGPLGVR